MIAVVSTGTGNVGSVFNMLRHLEFDARLATEPQHVLDADRIILPGVGHFDSAMTTINATWRRDVLDEAVQRQGKPVLGICLGMQLMTKRSAEGEQSGLGWVGGQTVAFDPTKGAGEIRIPHMGWNNVRREKSTPLDRALTDARFYFVHSYHVEMTNSDTVLASTRHGYSFASAFQVGNVVGVQFHPEKSHRFGMRLLQDFMEIG